MAEDKLPKTVSTATMVELLDVSEQFATKLARKGVLVRTARGRFELVPSLRQYLRGLREAVKARGGEDIGRQAAGERMRLAKEQADALALRNAALRRTLLDASEVERAWSDILRGVRAGMLAVPSRVGARLGHLTGHDITVIDREIRDALAGAAQDCVAGGGGSQTVPTGEDAPAAAAPSGNG